MENNKGQSIFLSVVGIATLLVAIVGATFAYFSITVEGNDDAQNIQATAAVVGGVTFEDGTADVTVTDVYPGWKTTKEFTVAQSTAGTTQDIEYSINLVVTTNDFQTKDDGAHASDVIYELTGASSVAGNTAVVTANDVTLPAAGTTQIGGSESFGTLRAGATADVHTYDFTVLFKELGTAQDYAQGNVINFKLRVDVEPNQGLRTADETPADGGFVLWEAQNAQTIDSE